VIAGFLTTAVPNWTGRMPVIGAPLGVLVALWGLGRVAMFYQDVLGPLAAAADSIFLFAFAAVIWREVLAGRNWRNLPISWRRRSRRKPRRRSWSPPAFSGRWRSWASPSPMAGC
jgi:uncharacterized protein involved in response to NO